MASVAFYIHQESKCHTGARCPLFIEHEARGGDRNGEKKSSRSLFAIKSGKRRERNSRGHARLNAIFGRRALNHLAPAIIITLPCNIHITRGILYQAARWGFRERVSGENIFMESARTGQVPRTFLLLQWWRGEKLRAERIFLYGWPDAAWSNLSEKERRRLFYSPNRESAHPR